MPSAALNVAAGWAECHLWPEDGPRMAGGWAGCHVWPEDGPGWRVAGPGAAFGRAPVDNFARRSVPSGTLGLCRRMIERLSTTPTRSAGPRRYQPASRTRSSGLVATSVSSTISIYRPK